MIKQGRGGRFICGNTIMALDGGFLHNAAAITPAAFAIRGQAAALELGPHNITVNSYACGPPPEEEIEGASQDPTRLTFTSNAKIPGARTMDRISNTSLKDVREMFDSRVVIPKKRFLGQDIAQVVSLLASKDSDFMTGQTIAISGGMVM
ncbi:hypothetical protein BDZ89DRAFT_1164006 [Hymenopellis radicata]|nr:hypothetical protein BDZ89DRAFT_1164006 [Hymenopellis radicata]